MNKHAATTILKVGALSALLSNGLLGEVPHEIETLIRQKEAAVEKIEITFRREMLDLRAKYVTQGKDEHVMLVQKILEGIDPHKVGDPVLGKWLMKRGNDISVTELREDGTASVGLLSGQAQGTWERNADQILIYRYGIKEVFTTMEIVDGKLQYKVPYKGKHYLITGERLP